MMDSLPNWLVHTVVLAALGFWTALLVNRGIAVFHDGLRLPMGEFVSGSMTRDELLATWKSLSQSFTIWFIPIVLGVGIVLGHLLFIPTDYLGVRARTWWAAGLLGGLYGAFVALGLIVVRGSLSALPVNMIDPLYRSLEPLVYGVMVIPAVAAGYQFGWRAGAVTLLVTIAAHIIGLQMPVLYANVLPTAAGLATLIAFGFRTLYKQRQAGEQIVIEPLESKASRIRAYWPWLAVQGALIALATNTVSFAWFPLDGAVAGNGFRGQAAFLVLVMGYGFLPTITTSASLTGVASVIGLMMVFFVGYLAPHPLLAAALGALVMAAETVYLPRVSSALDTTPIWREVADSLRGALDVVGDFAMIGGAFIVANSLLPHGVGVLIVAAVVALNDLSGWRIMRLAVGPVAILLVGLIANVILLLGVHL
jgi:hypothetical protein